MCNKKYCSQVRIDIYVRDNVKIITKKLFEEILFQSINLNKSNIINQIIGETGKKLHLKRSQYFGVISDGVDGLLVTHCSPFVLCVFIRLLKNLNEENIMLKITNMEGQFWIKLYYICLFVCFFILDLALIK